MITSAAVFSLYYEIGASRLTLQTLSACLRTSEAELVPLLGNSLPALLGANLTDEQTSQLDAARRALVYLTLARALREKLVFISDEGVQVVGSSTLRYRQPVTDKQLERSIQYFDEQASKFVTTLNTLMTPAPSPPTSTEPINPVRGNKIVSI